MNAQLSVSIKRFAIVAVVLLLSACGEAMNESQMVASAKDYLAKNQIRNASIELRNTLKANPGNAEARYLLAEVSMRIGDFATAEQNFQRAAKLGWAADEANTGELRAKVEQRKFKDVIEFSVDTSTWPKSTQANVLALKAVSYTASGDAQQGKKLLAAARELDSEAYNVARVSAQLGLLDKDIAAVEDVLSKALKRYPDDSALLLLQAHLEILKNRNDKALEIYQQIITMSKKGFMAPDVRAAHIGSMKLAVLAKDYDLVDRSRDMLLKRNANDPEVFYFMAVSEFEKKNFEAADEYLQKILKVTTSHAPTLLLSGTVNFAMQRFEQAAYYLSKYVVIDPGSVRAQKLLGRTYMALGQYDDAQNSFGAALKQKGDDAELIALVGLSELSSGEMQSGIEELERALSLAPDSSSLKKELARAYIAKGQTDDAIRQLDEVLQKGDQQYQARYMKILAYLRDKNTAKAIEVARAMLDDLPGNADALNLMGNVMDVSGDKAKAREFFNQALAIDAAHPASLLSLARLDESEGNLESAESHYTLLLKENPADTNAMISLARLALQRGDKEAQIKWLQSARKADKKQLFSRVALVEIYLDKNELSESEKLVRELEEAHATTPAVLAVKSRLLMAQKNYIQAESILDDFIKARPDQDVGYYLQGQTQLSLGKKSEALRNLRMAYELKPDVLRNAILLARVELLSGNLSRSLALSEKVIDAVPDSAVGYMIKGDALGARKEYRDALAAYDKAWSITQAQDVLLRRFKAMRRVYDENKAAELLVGWLQKNPDDAAVAFELAAVYDSRKNYSDAIKYYEVALKGLPENEQILNNLAWLYRNTNRSRALELSEKAYRLKPESPGIMDTYGWILLNTENATPEQLRLASRLLRMAMVDLSSIADVQYHYAVSLIKAGRESEGKKVLKELLDSGKAFDERDKAMKLLQ